MAAVFEASNAANLPLPTADSPLPLDSMPRAVLGMEGAENVPVQEFQPFDDAFTQRFTESIRIGEASDTESERLSEGDQSQTNGAQTGNKSPFNPTRDLPLLSWRKNGRGKVVSRVLDIRIPSHPVCKHQSEAAKVELIQQIEDIFPRITPPNDYADVRQGLLSRLRKIIADEWPGAGIDVYGSAGNGLGLRSADVDMSLYMPKSVAAALGREKGRPHPPKLILERLATLMEENDMIILNQLLDARVPVIKMQDPVSKLQVDVCINNILAVKNTQLLKAYVDLDERFRYVCILVKLWAKRRELNDAYTGTLSSYAYTLLVIHYLQTLQPPVLPCLQLMVGGERVTAITKLPKEMTDNGAGTLYNTYYDHSVTAETFKPENTMPVHELLLGFFRYFAYTFKYKTDLASIRLGARKPRSARAWDEKSIYGEWESKQAKYRTDLGIAKASLDARRKAEVKEQKLQEDGGVKANSGKGSGAGTAKKERVQFPKRPRLISKHLFCIEDPFDIDHDLSRGMEKAAVTVIRQEMMRAYEIIAESGDFEMACEEFR